MQHRHCSCFAVPYRIWWHKAAVACRVRESLGPACKAGVKFFAASLATMSSLSVAERLIRRLLAIAVVQTIINRRNCRIQRITCRTIGI